MAPSRPSAPARRPHPLSLEFLRRVPLTPEQRRRHRSRQIRRLAPFFRLLLGVGAVCYVGFLGWDHLVAGPEGVANALPLRLATAAILVLLGAASLHPKLARHWPWLAVLGVLSLNLSLTAIFALHPRGFDIGLPGYMFALGAIAVLPPTFGFALTGFAVLTLATLASMAVAQAPAESIANAAWFLVGFSALFTLFAWVVDQGRRRNLLLTLSVEAERARAEALVDAMLPAEVAARLRAGETRVAETAPGATVVFVDVVGYTRLVRGLGPEALVAFLTDAFAALDDLAARHGLAKIKTNGDSFMAAAGVPGAAAAGAAEAAAFAREALALGPRLAARLGQPIGVHVGLATGPVTAGVIGALRPQFDLWGATVNNAARLQAAAPEGEAWADAATAARLPEDATEPLGVMEFRGVGAIDVRRLRPHPLGG